MPVIEIERLEARKASDFQISAINDVYNNVFAEFYPDDPPRPAAELAAEFRSEPSSVLWDFWLAREGGVPTGVSRCWRDTKDNVHLGWVSTAVITKHRRKGLGSKLISHAISAATEEGRSLLFSSTAEGSPYGAFAERVGFERSRQKDAGNALSNHENRLDLEKIDRVLVSSWISGAQERALDYELVFWEGPTPADRLTDFARLMNVMNTAPMAEGEEDWDFTADKVTEFELGQAERGFEFWTFAARHPPSGSLAGYTRIYPNPWRTSLAYQEDTGVDPGHRNKGLGRWLKAAMIDRLMEERPETRTVITWNATSNEAMLSINNALGFRPYRTWLNWNRKI